MEHVTCLCGGERRAELTRTDICPGRLSHITFRVRLLYYAVDASRRCPFSPISTPPSPPIENATNVAGSEPDWGKIVEFCNRVQNSVGSSAMKGALMAIVKRMKHQDEHIQLQALAVRV